MELQEVIRHRRSIRQFLAKSVSEDLIREIIADSLWAPSWGNTQPWEILVVTGQKMAEFREKSKEALLAGKEATADIPMPQVWPDAYLNRYKELGKSVLGSLSITREDKEARLEHFVKMFGFFDAPAAVLVAVDKELALEYACWMRAYTSRPSAFWPMTGAWEPALWRPWSAIRILCVNCFRFLKTSCLSWAY